MYLTWLILTYIDPKSLSLVGSCEKRKKRKKNSFFSQILLAITSILQIKSKLVFLIKKELVVAMRSIRIEHNGKDFVSPSAKVGMQIKNFVYSLHFGSFVCSKEMIGIVLLCVLQNIQFSWFTFFMYCSSQFVPNSFVGVRMWSIQYSKELHCELLLCFPSTKAVTMSCALLVLGKHFVKKNCFGCKF